MKNNIQSHNSKLIHLLQQNEVSKKSISKRTIKAVNSGTILPFAPKELEGNLSESKFVKKVTSNQLFQIIN